MITTFIDVLHQAGLQPTDIEVADMLFLAQYMSPVAQPHTSHGIRAASAVHDTPREADAAPSPPPELMQRTARSPDDSSRGPQPGDLFLPSAQRIGGDTPCIGALSFRTPIAPA